MTEQQYPAEGQPTYGQPAYGQPAYGQPAYGQPAYGQPSYGQPANVQPYGQPPYGGPGVPAYAGPGGWAGGHQGGPVGKVRSTGVCILLSIVTLGIYQLVWYYSTHEEMKRHSGQGMGGGLALVLAFFVGIVMPYLSSSEIGELYERRGLRKPVSGATGLWYFPGILILVGPLVWFIKTNGALNAYWRSLGTA
jgi:hypothetical protein